MGIRKVAVVSNDDIKRWKIYKDELPLAEPWHAERTVNGVCVSANRPAFPDYETARVFVARHITTAHRRAVLAARLREQTHAPA